MILPQSYDHVILGHHFAKSRRRQPPAFLLQRGSDVRLPPYNDVRKLNHALLGGYTLKAKHVITGLDQAGRNHFLKKLQMIAARIEEPTPYLGPIHLKI
jgi:hypothetical protein